MALDILAKVREYLNIDPTDTQYDTFLGNLITDVSSRVEDICQQPIEQTAVYVKELLIDTVTEGIYKGNQYVVLPYTVPTTVLTVEYSVPFTGVWTSLALHTDYETFYDGYIQKIWFIAGIQERYTYRISCAVGYTGASMPATIKDVATEMVAMKFKESVVNENILGKTNVASSQSGISSTTTYKSMEAIWKEKLGKYSIYAS
jgi:hypothetical protein